MDVQLADLRTNDIDRARARRSTRRPAEGIFVSLSRDVLVVEDHELMRHGLMRALRRQVSLGLVRGAGDGADGLRLALTNRPGVLLVDQRLPRKSGLEIARALLGASGEPATRVLLMTATPTAALRSEAAAAGVFAVIDKALDRHAICAAVVRAAMAECAPIAGDRT